MSLVSGRFLNDFLRAIGRWQVDVDALLGDLPVGWGGSQRQHELVEWDLFVELMQRLERRVHGPKGLEDLGELIAGLKPARTLRRLAGLSASPLLLFQAGQRWALPRALPELETQLEPQSDGSLAIRCRIPDRDRACPQIFHLAVGASRAFPRILDLPDAVVSAQISDREARLRIVLPPSGTLWARGRRTFRAIFSARAALQQLELQQLELRSHFDELRLAYAALEESEARQRALVDSLADAVIEISPEGRVVFVGPAIEELSGYRPDQVIGSHFSLWLHREDCEVGRKLVASALEQDQIVAETPVFRIRHQRGEWIWVTASLRPLRNRNGGTGGVAVLRDASLRVQERAQMARAIEDFGLDGEQQVDPRELRPAASNLVSIEIPERV